ncbi:MAG: potassium channel family protein [Bulleidia sp.]
MVKSILLIGLGRFGRYTAQKLNELNQEVMAIDRNEDHVNKVLNYVTNAQIGNATDPDFMESLGISNFDVCIVAIGDDFLSSLETTALLKELGAKKVISRATGKSQEKFLLRNGADEVVFPERQLAIWTAIHCSSMSIANYIELSDGYSIFELKTPSSWAGKTLDSLNVRRTLGINILGIKKNGVLDMQVTADTMMSEGTTVLALGREDDLKRLMKLE